MIAGDCCGTTTSAVEEGGAVGGALSRLQFEERPSPFVLLINDRLLKGSIRTISGVLHRWKIIFKLLFVFGSYIKQLVAEGEVITSLYIQ